MSKINHLIFVLLFLFKLVDSAFSQSLYLVMANDDREISGMAVDKESWKKLFYYKKLYKIDKGQLELIDTLNAFNNQTVEKLVHFPDLNLFYIEERDFVNHYPLNYSFTFLDYGNDELALRRYYSRWDSLWTEDNYDWLGYSFIRNNKLIIRNQSLPKLKPSDDLISFGIDKYFKKYQIKLDDISNLYFPGFSNLQSGFNYFISFPCGKFSKLKITWNENYDRMPDAPWQLPDSLKDYEEWFYSIVISNEQFLVLRNSPHKIFIPDTTSKMYLYEKINNTWDTIRLPGFGNKIKNYKQWLYGEDMRNDTCEFDRSSDYCYDRYWSERKMLEKKYNLHNGRPNSFLTYLGILFLYHIPTKKLIKWQARDRDSEIIQIIDGMVYYRVFDELRKVKLDEKILNIDWSTDELMVKNKDIIPYVHYIFFSNTTQTKCKEIWVNKPEK